MTIPATVMMNAPISKIFSNNVVFDSGSGFITKRKRIMTPKIPAPSTINVLFMSFSPSLSSTSIQFVIMKYGYNTCLFRLIIKLNSFTKTINALSYFVFI